MIIMVLAPKMGATIYHGDFDYSKVVATHIEYSYNSQNGYYNFYFLLCMKTLTGGGLQPPTHPCQRHCAFVTSVVMFQLESSQP